MASSASPSLDDLLTLLTVADEGTEGAAAKVLGIKQPVVSRRLRVFRKSPPLVRLSKGRVELTDQGRAALPAIRRFLRQYDHLKPYLAGRNDHSHQFAIGVGVSASQFYLARAIADLQRRLPDWEIQTRVQRGKDRVAGVVEGRLDAALVTHSTVQIEGIARWACNNQADLQIEELAALPMCVIAQRQTPAAQRLQAVLAGQVVPVDMLAEFPLAGLDPESGIRRQIEALMRERGQRVTFTLEAGGWLGVKEFVRQQLCAGLMPLALMWPEETKQFMIRRVSPELSVAYRIVHRRDTEEDTLDQVKAALRKAAEGFQQEVERRWSRVL